MKNLLTVVLFLTIAFGAKANRERATIIINTVLGSNFEVNVNGVTQENRGNQFTFSDLNPGNQQVSVFSLIAPVANYQSVQKKLIFRGALEAEEGMVTIYFLDRNVMKLAQQFPLEQYADYHSNGPYHPNVPIPPLQHPNCPPQPTCGPPPPHPSCGPPPHQCNSGCNHGNVGYNNNYGWNGYSYNYCNHFIHFGFCNNPNCHFVGCQSSNYGNNYPIYGNNYPNHGNIDNESYNNNWLDYNHQGNGCNNGTFGNGYKEKISPQEFSVFMKQLQGTFFEDDKVRLIKQAIDQKWVDVKQVKAIIGDIFFEERKLEVAKYLFSKTIDQQNFYQINEAFFFSSNQKELQDYIVEVRN